MVQTEQSLEEQQWYQDRVRQLEELRSKGIEPYPYSFNTTHTTTQIRRTYDDSVNPGEQLEDRVAIAGRVMGIRTMGKQTFLDLADQHGRIQISLRKEVIGDEAYHSMKSDLNRGDIIGVEGTIVKTRKGELSVHSATWELLTKSVRPLPAKEYLTEDMVRKGGLADQELRYRQPELRFIMEPESREVLVKRSRAISTMREILERERYLEVETPLLQPIHGGASARPFITKLNALDTEVYLSISPELYLKRLIVGGLFDGVYTICKNFRNEGIDRTHNPEFTMMECYKPWKEYTWLMRFTENMWEEIFTRVNGTAEAGYHMPGSILGAQTINFKAPWKRVTMTDLVAEHTGLDVAFMDEEELRERVQRVYQNNEPYLSAEKLGTAYANLSWGSMVQALFEEYAEHHLIQPTFVIDHPRESTPLCKGHRSDKRLIERFESFIYGVETSNAYSELNDPILQRKLLEEQARYAAAGDEEAQRMDELFCRSIEYGAPPMAGLGIGIDRMVMFLTGSSTIRDVIAFPFMRPENKY